MQDIYKENTVLKFYYQIVRASMKSANFINNNNVKTHESKSILNNEKTVREALTKIWISRQRHESIGESFEEELNEQELISSQQAHLPQLDEEVNNTEGRQIADDKFSQVQDDRCRHNPSRLISRHSEGIIRNISTCKNTQRDRHSYHESISPIKLNSKAEPTDFSNEDHDVSVLRLPQLKRTISPRTSLLSKENSAESNDSSPLSTPPPGLSPRLRLSDSLPRNFPGFAEDRLAQGRYTARSLPASPRVRRFIVAKSSDLTSERSRDFPNDHIVPALQFSTPKMTRRRPDTPVTHDLSRKDHVFGSLCSCSDLHLIKETAPIQTSKTLKHRHRLLPDIVN